MPSKVVRPVTLTFWNGGSAALVALVVQNTSLVIFLKQTFRIGAVRYAPATVVLVTEIVKLLTCSAVHLADRNSTSLLAVIGQIRHQGLLFLPPILYVVQNNLLFFGAERLPSLLYMLCSQTKILATAMMSMLMLGTEINTKQYFHLVLLIFGIVIVQSQQGEHPDYISDASRSSNLLGIIAVFLASLTSATAGIVLEKIFKMSTSSNTTTVHTIWSRNIQMSLISIPVAAAVVHFQDFERLVGGTFFEGYDAVVWFVVALQAIGGIITAYVLKFASNVLKCLAIAISICCCAMYSVISGELKITISLVMGVFLVCASVGGYSMSTKQMSPENPTLVPGITEGQSTLLRGRACPEVAFLRELKGNCVSFW
jgi:UDP-sugar transporter A1/2/3